MKNRVVQLKSRAIWWNIEELHGDKRWGQVTESGVTECICRAHFKFHALEAILKPYSPEKYKSHCFMFYIDRSTMFYMTY